MKIQVGTILIATDHFARNDEGKDSFIVGKEYEVRVRQSGAFSVESELNMIHIFYLKDEGHPYYGNYFKLKEQESELSETERLQLQLESAQQQRYTALLNAFSTIEAFAVPSYTPLYEGYDKFRKYLLEMYNPNK